MRLNEECILEFTAEDAGFSPQYISHPTREWLNALLKQEMLKWAKFERDDYMGRSGKHVVRYPPEVFVEAKEQVSEVLQDLFAKTGDQSIIDRLRKAIDAK